MESERFLHVSYTFIIRFFTKLFRPASEQNKYLSNRIFYVYYYSLYLRIFVTMTWVTIVSKKYFVFYLNHDTLLKKNGLTRKYLCLKSNLIPINDVPDIIERFQRTCAYGYVLYLKLNLCTTPFS